MHPRTTLAPALLALALAAVPLGAQQDGSGQAETGGDRTGETAGEITGETAAETPETAEGETAAADTSPYDYQSSEDISEDRSVSFPVDI